MLLMIVSVVAMLPSDVCGDVKSPATCRAKIEIDIKVRAIWQSKEGWNFGEFLYLNA